MIIHADANIRTKCSVILREAARIALERTEPVTICDALSSILPRDEHGTTAWRHAKDVLRYCLPDAFEAPAGWWRMEDREPRVLGALLCAAMSEDWGD